MDAEITFSMLKQLITKVRNIFLPLFKSQTIIGLFNCTLLTKIFALYFRNELLIKKTKTKVKLQSDYYLPTEIGV
jgi:hypothetical protein